MVSEEPEEVSSRSPLTKAWPNGVPDLGWVWIAAIILAVLIGGTLLGLALLRSVGYWPIKPPTPTPEPVPVLVLTPNEGRPGEPIIATGVGWSAGEIITLRLMAPEMAMLSPIDLLTTTTGTDGTFNVIFSIPVVRPWSEFPAVTVAAVTVGEEASVTGTRAVAVFDIVPETTATPTPVPPTATPTLTATPLTPTTTPTPEVSDWRGEYFNNITLTGSPAVVRNDSAVSFNWGTQAPASGLLLDGFSVRWARTVAFSRGDYRFYVNADDGVRIWLDDQLLIDEWHGAMGATYTADRTLRGGDHTIMVEYYEAQGDARINVWWERPSEFPQWRGEYFDNVSLSGTPSLTRNDVNLNFVWGFQAPASDLPVDRFSARWRRTINVDQGIYRFRALVDDGVRIYVDGTRILDAWSTGSQREVTADVPLNQGAHAIRVEYYEATGQATIQVSWEELGAYPDWKAEYWNNADLSGLPVLVRNDVNLDFNWRRESPDIAVPTDDFSARWTRRLTFTPGTYRFSLVVDDGARLFIDNRLVIDAWEDGSQRELAVDLPLASRAHTIQLFYYEKTGQARVRLTWAEIEPSFPDWKGEYWSNAGLSGQPSLVRNDEEIDFAWGNGAPDFGLPDNNFSVRWSRTVTLDAGIYRFSAMADDGIRIIVDGEVVLDEWQVSGGDITYESDVPLVKGQHLIVVEYFENSGLALVQAGFERLGGLSTATPTATLTATPTTEPTTAPTLTPTSTSTPTPTPTVTPSPTITPILSFTLSPTPSSTPTPTPSPIPTETLSMSPLNFWARLGGKVWGCREDIAP